MIDTAAVEQVESPPQHKQSKTQQHIPGGQGEQKLSDSIKKGTPEKGKDLTKLKENIASFAGGIEIPISLSEQLGLQGLEWNTLEGTDTHRLTIGSLADSNPMGNIDNAAATIETFRKRIEDSEGNYLKTVPERLCIAGIDQNQGRIVAMQWDLKNNCLAKVSASIPVNESLEILKTLDFDTAAAEKLITPTVTENDKPYDAAGFITTFMHDINNSNIKKDPKNKWTHDRVLTFNFDDAESAHLLKKCGYYFKNENGITKVGFEGKETSGSNLKSWSLKIPTALQKGPMPHPHT